MQRASFTVAVKRQEGIVVRFDADCLVLGTRHAPDANETGGAISTLSFRCSGGMETVDASDVESVTFHPAGATFCPYCDGSLWNHVGHGIHANPTPPEGS